MSIINKTLLIAIALITAILSFSTSFVPVAYATEQGKDACEIAGYNDPTICGHKNKNNEQELQNRVRSILNTVYLWIGIIATIVIIIAGRCSKNSESQKRHHLRHHRSHRNPRRIRHYKPSYQCSRRPTLTFATDIHDIIRICLLLS